jgi:hypothetical protein
MESYTLFVLVMGQGSQLPCLPTFYQASSLSGVPRFMAYGKVGVVLFALLTR